MLNKRYISIGLLLGLLLSITCLFLSFDNPLANGYIYPVDSFRSLTGTFGETRSNHFHSGLDIRIGGRVGTPIRATADGYVSRINASPFGFGKAIYLRHTDGQYSVYAHLSGYRPDIAQKIYQAQVRNKQFAQEVFLKPNEIPVSQGEVIGYGGNSGSSSGPHLHFEIRDPQQRVINPMQYFKDELSDNLSPVVQEIAFEPLNDLSRVNNQFEIYRTKLIRRGNTFSLPQTIYLTGEVGLSYRALDFLDASRFRCGINFVKLYLDNKLIYEMTLNRFSFGETRYLNRHIDYELYKKEGIRFEKAFIDEGNRFSAYNRKLGRGIIALKDDQLHQLRLELEDFHGNSSIVNATVQRQPDQPVDTTGIDFTDQPVITYEVKRNVLAFRVECPAPAMMERLTVINELGLEVDLEPVYATQDALHYLYPLDSLLTPFALVDHQNIVRYRFDFKHLVSPGKSSHYKDQGVELRFPENATYQNVYLSVKTEPRTVETFGPVFYIGDPTTPLHTFCTFSFDMPPTSLQNQLYVAYKDEEDGWTFVGNSLQEGKITARVRELGAYTIMLDSIAPQIRPYNFRNRSRIGSQQTLILKIIDEQSGIQHTSIVGTLNGEWILFEYDYKNDAILHYLTDKLPTGTHELYISVKDEVGNLSEASYQLTAP